MPDALSRTWYTDVDAVLPDTTTDDLYCQSTLWAIKAAMVGEILDENQPVGARWTVVGSSDGATAGMDEVDRWGDTFDASKIVMGTGGSARSWIVLKSPDAIGPIYIIISYQVASNYTYGLWVTKDLPTGGSTTARPTATAETTWSSTGTWHTAVPTAPGATYRVHRVCDADGHFLLFFGKQTTNRFYFAFGCWPLTDTAAGDENPWVFISCFTDSVGSGPLSTNAGNFRTYGTDSAMKSRLHDDSQGLPMAPLTLNPYVSSGQDLTSELTQDFVDGKYREFDVPVCCNTTSFKTMKGRLVDWKVSSTLIPQCSVFEAGGPITHIFVGNSFVPFSDTPTT